MKIKIIPEKCIACGLCHVYAPEVFDYDDDGIVRFYRTDALESEFAESQTQAVSAAVKACPTGALQIPRQS